MASSANFTQSRNDLYWTFWGGDDGTIRWFGYDDANWWQNVSKADHARKRVGAVTGRTFVLNHDNGEVAVFD